MIGQEVGLPASGDEELRFTVVLSCLADGTKIRPYTVFKRKTLPKGERFPKDVTVCADDEGFTNEKRGCRMVSACVELYTSRVACQLAGKYRMTSRNPPRI